MSTNTINQSSSSHKLPGLLSIFDKSPKRLKRIQFLAELFKTNGYELRIAGGAVRDILTNKEPHDIDFATDARPEQSLEILKKHEDILRIIVTAAGQRHGTVAVKFKEAEIDFKRIKLSPKPDQQESNSPNQTNAQIDKPEYDEESPYEITTLRCDVVTDGRHAEVQFINDWRIDAERRDLTINAMFLTLDEGKIVDYFKGESDLSNNVVRFVGDAELRIKEDYLRILRFFRFWSRYGRQRQPDEDTMLKLRNNMNGLEGISGERIHQELKKIMTYYPVVEVMELMLRLRVFDYTGMNLSKPDEYDSYCKEVLEETKIVQDHIKTYLDQLPEKKKTKEYYKKFIDILPVLLFCPLLRDENMCLNAHKRLKFSNVERDTIIYTVMNKHKNPDNILAYKYQMAMTTGQERPLMLMRIKAFLVYKNKLEFIDKLDSWKVPTFPIDGNLVTSEVKKRKLPPIHIKTCLVKLKDAWASSNFTITKEELIQKLCMELDEIKK